MPVRDRVVHSIIENAMGGPLWFDHGECQTMPQEAYRRLRDAADLLYTQVVTTIDFNRVLIEAAGRHLALDHKSEQPCGECVREALMVTDHFFAANDGWTHTPYIPRPDAVDWAHVVAESLKHRSDHG